MSESHLDEKFGIVVFLDALGVRGLSLESAKSFIKNRDALLPETKSELWLAMSGAEAFDPGEVTTPEVVTFGDTIILTWECKKDQAPRRLYLLGRYLQNIIWKGLEKKMALRGSVSIGSYIKEKEGSTILGPAVTDAASWYEEAQWIGLVATPRCGFYLSLPNDLVKDITNRFMVYPVPMPDNKVLNLLSVTWPAVAYYEPSPEPSRKIFALFKEFPVPKGTEEKYFNTLSFVEWYCDKRKA